MSSKPEAQNEPTMEEILASIRRIISEDEPEGKSAAAPAAPAQKPVSATPAPEAAAPAAPPPAAEPAASGRGADNILELTKMVAEDGSIVDLEAQPASEAETAAEAPEETPEEIAEEPAEAAVEEAEAGEAPAEEASGAAAESEPEPEPEPEPEVEAAEEPAEETAEEIAEEPAEEAVEAADEAVAEEAPAMADAEEDLSAEATGQAATGQTLAPAGEGDGTEYVSPDTAALATASLAAVTKAAMANRQGGAVAIGGGRTLEELVRESLAPELKGWLDENLPDLVERIVREEIRKMVRRAEDQ